MAFGGVGMNAGGFQDRRRVGTINSPTVVEYPLPQAKITATGFAETLGKGPRFQVRQIHLPPGEALGLQSHLHRAEHWVVVQGTAMVTLSGEVRLVSEGETIAVPVGAQHRVENPGRLPMVLIAVQTGTYLGADDIICYADNPGGD